MKQGYFLSKVLDTRILIFVGFVGVGVASRGIVFGVGGRNFELPSVAIQSGWNANQWGYAKTYKR